MQEVIFESEALKGVVRAGDKSLEFELTDKRSGRTWGPTPLLHIEVHDKPVRTEQILREVRIDRVTELGDGVHVTVGHRAMHVDVGLWVRIEGDELVVTLSPGEVYERDPRLHRVFAIDVLPELLTASAGEKVILPVNSGVVFDPADKPERRDAFLLYAEQERWELVPTIPVCAVKGDGAGLMILASKGDCDAQCRVATDGAGSAGVGFAFSLRRHWPDPVDASLREFRYRAIPADADPVVYVSKRLRRHVTDTLGKPTLRERAAESPEAAYLLDAYVMKLFYAVENEGAMMAGKEKSDPVTFVDVMTFAEAGENLRRLHDAGVGKILTQSVGWNLRGHDGLYPTRFPVEPRLGGEAGFRELLRLGSSLGYQMNVHDNYMMNVGGSPDFDPDCIIQDIHGEPLVHGCWGGGVEYASWPLALSPERVEGNMHRVKDLGLEGMYYMDYMAQPLEVNYHPKHRGPRGDHARGMADIVAKARNIFGSAGVEFGFLPVAVEADMAVNCGTDWHIRLCRPEWPITPLLEKRVPIWELALHGLVLNEGQALSWAGAMTNILMGKHPRDEWSARPGVMPVLDDERIAKLKAMYDLVLGRFGSLQAEELTDYAEPADGVKCTRYADGTEVTADFNEGRLEVNGRAIERPEAL